MEISTFSTPAEVARMNYTMPAQDTYDVGVVTPPSPALADLARAYIEGCCPDDAAELLAMLGLA